MSIWHGKSKLAISLLSKYSIRRKSTLWRWNDSYEGKWRSKAHSGKKKRRGMRTMIVEDEPDVLALLYH
jgi:hypothetical protein